MNCKNFTLPRNGFDEMNVNEIKMKGMNVLLCKIGSSKKMHGTAYLSKALIRNRNIFGKHFEQLQL